MTRALATAEHSSRFCTELANALKDTRILLVIDQFEDVLSSLESREVDELISGILHVRQLSSPQIHILISYRADLEGRLGEFWQIISGSPRGLARVYLETIGESEAWSGIERMAEDLEISLQLTETEKARVRKDLAVVSQSAHFQGTYPPFVQMLVDHIWSAAKAAPDRSYHFAMYTSTGGMDGVVGGYLSRQLEYAQDRGGHARAVLASLVRSYGVRAQRTLGEVSTDARLSRDDCDAALERLIDLRLVRHIDPYYEVAHDFVAKRVIAELVDSEERETKRFQELLSTKAAAYESTEGLLSAEELLMLFKHKENIIPNEQELRLLLLSWIEGNGPALYWILGSGEPKKLLQWLRAAEADQQIERDQKVSIVLLRKKLGESPLVEADYSAFRNYQLSAELAFLILSEPLLMPRKLLLYGLRHRREEVRNACFEAVAKQVADGRWDWLDELRRSGSPGCRRAFERLIQVSDIPVPPSEIVAKSKASREFGVLKKISLSKSADQLRQLQETLKGIRPSQAATLLGGALGLFRQGNIRKLLNEAHSASAANAQTVLSAIYGRISKSVFRTLLVAYKKWTTQEGGRYQRPATYSRNVALAEVLRRSTVDVHLPALRHVLARLPLKASVRDLTLALLERGTLDDYGSLIERVALAKYPVDFPNHTELGHIAAGRLSSVAPGVPDFLIQIALKREFWEGYLHPSERQSWPKEDLLDIASVENRQLYVRLTAYGIIGTAGRGDRQLLVRLTKHPFGLIARAAAVSLVRMIGKEGLDSFRGEVDQVIREGKAEDVAKAIRAGEIEHFRLARLW